MTTVHWNELIWICMHACAHTHLKIFNSTKILCQSGTFSCEQIGSENGTLILFQILNWNSNRKKKCMSLKTIWLWCTSERQHTLLLHNINLDLNIDRSQLCNQVTENIWHLNFFHLSLFLTHLTMNLLFILTSTLLCCNHWRQDAATCLTEQHL